MSRQELSDYGRRRYLGDAVYAHYDGWLLWLTTEDGISTTNRVALEPEVYQALVAYVADLRPVGGRALTAEEQVALIDAVATFAATEAAAAEGEAHNATDNERQGLELRVDSLTEALGAAERERDEARESIAKWREYVEFLYRANKSPITLAHLHGWRCPQADIDEGKRRRAELDRAALAPAPGRPPQKEGDAQSAPVSNATTCTPAATSASRESDAAPRPEQRAGGASGRPPGEEP